MLRKRALQIVAASVISVFVVLAFVIYMFVNGKNNLIESGADLMNVRIYTVRTTTVPQHIEIDKYHTT